MRRRTMPAGTGAPHSRPRKLDLVPACRNASSRTRRATPGETVTSLEGGQRARTGDWVVRDPTGNEWLVPERVFASSYRLVGADGHTASSGGA